MAETRKDHSEHTVYPQAEDPHTDRKAVPANTEDVTEQVIVPPVEEGRFAFLKTRRFYVVLLMG